MDNCQTDDQKLNSGQYCNYDMAIQIGSTCYFNGNNKSHKTMQGKTRELRAQCSGLTLSLRLRESNIKY